MKRTGEGSDIRPRCASVPWETDNPRVELDALDFFRGRQDSGVHCARRIRPVIRSALLARLRLAVAVAC